MRVGIDLDGVCYDFAASLRKYLCGRERQDCDLCQARYPDPERWEFYEDWGISLEEFEKLVRQGVEAGVIFRQGEPHPGTAEALKTLLDEGHEIIFVTDRVGLGGEAAMQNTWEWIGEHFPFLYEPGEPYETPKVSNCRVFFEADKTKIKTDIFIDDKIENYEALDLHGVEVWLWDRPWNRLKQGAHRVYSWDQFVSRVRYLAGEDELYKQLRNKQLEAATEASSLMGRGEVRVTSSTGGQKGKKLARFSLIPKKALTKVAELYGKGAEKYDDWNWRKGYPFSLSQDALERHYALWCEGQTYDEETGCHHLAAVIFHALSLMTFEEEHPEMDDRWKGDAA